MTKVDVKYLFYQQVSSVKKHETGSIGRNIVVAKTAVKDSNLIMNIELVISTLKAKLSVTR